MTEASPEAPVSISTQPQRQRFTLVRFARVTSLEAQLFVIINFSVFPDFSSAQSSEISTNGCRGILSLLARLVYSTPNLDDYSLRISPKSLQFDQLLSPLPPRSHLNVESASHAQDCNS